MKSPLKAPPLPNPGDSVERTRREFVDNKIVEPALIALFMIALAVAEWIRWAFDSPPSPFTLSVMAVIVVGYAIVRVRRARRSHDALKLGRDGERFVGQFLETVRRDGAHVFHDVPGSGFNLDHVVVHRSGIYAIETKTRSKPDHGGSKVVFDGEFVFVDGGPADSSPVIQVRAARKWLRDRLRSMTGHVLPVRGVLIYPDWFVERTDAGKLSDIWVLHQAGFPAFIKRERAQLSHEQIALSVDCLERYIRSETGK